MAAGAPSLVIHAHAVLLGTQALAVEVHEVDSERWAWASQGERCGRDDLAEMAAEALIVSLARCRFPPAHAVLARCRSS